MFGHEKLGAYQSAVQFAAIAAQILNTLPVGNSHLSDQLKRASISIALNIAEGSGKQTELDKKRFYSIARGSAMECAAVLDILKLLSLISAEVHAEGKEHLHAVVGILSAICRREGGQRPRQGQGQ